MGYAVLISKNIVLAFCLVSVKMEEISWYKIFPCTELELKYKSEENNTFEKL